MDRRAKNPVQIDAESQAIIDALRVQVRNLEEQLAAAEARVGSRVETTKGEIVATVFDRSDITADTRAGTELPDREEYMQRPEGAHGIGTWDWDLVTNELNWSPELYRLLGVPPDTRPSLGVWERLVYPEDRDRAYEHARNVIRSGTVLDTEFRIMNPNGKTRWISVLGRVFRNEAGEAVRIFGLNVDLTARRQGEQRAAFLLRLEDVTRPLTDPGEITQAAARSLGEHLNVNRCAYADVEDDEDTFNLTGDFNLDVPSIVGRYTFTQFGAECLRLMRSGQPYIVEDSESDPRTEQVRDSYRQTQIRSVICVPLLKGGRFAAAMAVHAITPRRWRDDEVELLQVVASRCWESIERARAEMELRSQWHTFDTLISNVPDLMCTFDVDGRLTYANSALLHVWQKTLPEIIGKNTFDLSYPPELANRLQSEVGEVVTDRAIRSQSHSLYFGRQARLEHTSTSFRRSSHGEGWWRLLHVRLATSPIVNKSNEHSLTARNAYNRSFSRRLSPSSCSAAETCSSNLRTLLMRPWSNEKIS